MAGRRAWLLLLALFLFLFQRNLLAQETDAFSRLSHGIEWQMQSQRTLAGGQTPLWLQANRQGLSSVRKNNNYLRGSIFRRVEMDSLRKWKVGYGADIAWTHRMNAPFVVQQLYAELQYDKVRFSLGSKEREMQLKNNTLSTGAQTLGINARPVPQARLELPEYLPIDHGHWWSVKGHLAYGMLTDGGWVQNHAKDKYMKNALYHSKAAYLRIGNEARFPLVFEGGLEMACLFGGDFYAVNAVTGKTHKQKMKRGLKQAFEALYGGGEDPGEGIYANAGGNTLGSWLMSLSYRVGNGKIRAYYDHFFEDHSMMFFEYGMWKDGLFGLELTLPKNKVAQNIVLEYITTKDQTGPIYHDHTSTIPDQISARDDYYNHSFYNGWGHWGQAIGNPLYTSPAYAGSNSLSFPNNRFNAWHLGLDGSPFPWMSYRLLCTYQESWGTYVNPYTDKKYDTSLLAECTFYPYKNHDRLSVTLGYGQDHGSLLGHHGGFQLTLSRRGFLCR